MSVCYNKANNSIINTVSVVFVQYTVVNETSGKHEEVTCL